MIDGTAKNNRFVCFGLMDGGVDDGQIGEWVEVRED